MVKKSFFLWHNQALISCAGVAHIKLESTAFLLQESLKTAFFASKNLILEKSQVLRIPRNLCQSAAGFIECLLNLQFILVLCPMPMAHGHPKIAMLKLRG